MNHDRQTDTIEQQRDVLQQLLDDHVVVRDVLASMEQRVIEERRGRIPEDGFWELVVEFFENHATSFHHSFEDGRLFAELSRGGFAAQGSSARIARQEHERMDPFLEHLRHAVRTRNPFELRATVQSFVALHRQHMEREETSVFPLLRAAIARDGGEGLLEDLRFLEADAADERARAERVAEAIRNSR